MCHANAGSANREGPADHVGVAETEGEPRDDHGAAEEVNADRTPTEEARYQLDVQRAKEKIEVHEMWIKEHAWRIAQIEAQEARAAWNEMETQSYASPSPRSPPPLPPAPTPVLDFFKAILDFFKILGMGLVFVVVGIGFCLMPPTGFLIGVPFLLLGLLLVVGLVATLLE